MTNYFVSTPVQGFGDSENVVDILGLNDTLTLCRIYNFVKHLTFRVPFTTIKVKFVFILFPSTSKVLESLKKFSKGWEELLDKNKTD